MDQHRSINILLVEDNPGDIRLMKEVFKEFKMDHVLNCVLDGEEAVLYLRKSGKFFNSVTPDLILLDLNLPKKSGKEVLAEIKEDKELRRIPVIILTTSQAEQDIKDAYERHANCYIMKPVEFDQFLVVVKTIEHFWFSMVRLPDNGRSS